MSRPTDFLDDDEGGSPADMSRSGGTPGELDWLTDSHNGSQSLVDLVNRVLDRGVVITGHVTLSVAGVDLVYLGLNAVLTSIAGAQESVASASGDTDDGPAGPDGDRKDGD